MFGIDQQLGEFKALLAEMDRKLGRMEALLQKLVEQQQELRVGNITYPIRIDENALEDVMTWTGQDSNGNE